MWAQFVLLASLSSVGVRTTTAFGALRPLTTQETVAVYERLFKERAQEYAARCMWHLSSW